MLPNPSLGEVGSKQTNKQITRLAFKLLTTDSDLHFCLSKISPTATDLLLAWNPICLGLIEGLIGKVQLHTGMNSNILYLTRLMVNVKIAMPFCACNSPDKPSLPIIDKTKVGFVSTSQTDLSDTFICFMSVSELQHINNWLYLHIQWFMYILLCFLDLRKR